MCQCFKRIAVHFGHEKGESPTQSKMIAYAILKDTSNLFVIILRLTLEFMAFGGFLIWYCRLGTEGSVRKTKMSIDEGNYNKTFVKIQSSPAKVKNCCKSYKMEVFSSVKSSCYRGMPL